MLSHQQDRRQNRQHAPERYLHAVGAQQATAIRALGEIRLDRRAEEDAATRQQRHDLQDSCDKQQR